MHYHCSEQEILREEIASLQAVKTRLKQKVTELEDELKKSKEELEKAKKSGGGQQEEGEVRKCNSIMTYVPLVCDRPLAQQHGIFHLHLT